MRWVLGVARCLVWVGCLLSLRLMGTPGHSVCLAVLIMKMLPAGLPHFNLARFSHNIVIAGPLLMAYAYGKTAASANVPATGH